MLKCLEFQEVNDSVPAVPAVLLLCSATALKLQLSLKGPSFQIFLLLAPLSKKEFRHTNKFKDVENSSLETLVCAEPLNTRQFSGLLLVLFILKHSVLFNDLQNKISQHFHE